MPCSEPLRKTKANVRLAGTIREGENDQAQIYDVEYTREGSLQVDARSVLAGPSKAQLREIHAQVNRNGGAFLSTEISPKYSWPKWVRARWQSSDGSSTDHYVQQRDAQWLPLDFGPVFEAARRVLPDSYIMDAATGSLDIESKVYRIDAGPEGDIEVPFRIAERVIPGVARFHLGKDSPRLWTRRLETGIGSDPPNAMAPHPIRFFQPHPCLRQNREDRIGQCSAASPEDRQKWLAARSKLREVGQIGEYKVFELDYLEAGYNSPTQIRTALVGRSLDALYEIWGRDSTNNSLGGALPVKIVMAGGTQPLIETNFSDGGMYVYNYQSFFWLGPRGPRLVDFAPVGKAAQKAIPKTEALYDPATGYGVRRLRFTVGTYERAIGFRKVACCVGLVEVPYTIEDGVATPVQGKATYRRITSGTMARPADR